MNRSARRRLVGVVLALGAIPGVGQAQVFLASRPHPEFAIGSLLIVAGVQPDLGPVAVRVSFGLTLPPNARVEDMRQDLYLLCGVPVKPASWPASRGVRFVTG